MERFKSWLEKSINAEAVKFFEVDEIKIDEKIGGGAFGHVHKAKLLRSTPPTIVAVKLFKNTPDFEADPKTQEDLIREIKLLRTVNFHENILSFYGVCKDPETEAYMLVLEYADGGSLREYLSKNKGLPGRDRILLAKEITSGVACLHKNSIIHRDLNSANILVHQGHIKIADLGLSKKVEVKLTASNVTAATAAAAAAATIDNTSKVQGHLQYIDPQCYIDMDYVRSKKSDVYSIGVVFWELSSGKIPFSFLGSTQAISRIINGVRENPIDGTPKKFIDLYTKCWDQEPENRPEIDEVYETLDEIKWETEVTSTEAASSDSEPKDETSITISEELNKVQIVRPMEEAAAIPEESTTLLKGFFDAGNETDDIREYIEGYLRESSRTPRDLFEMLGNEGELGGESMTNHPHALLVGFCYYKGIGVARTYVKALDIFKQLAKDKRIKEDQYVKYFLGECYRSGLGVDVADEADKEENRKQAFEWFEESAKGGASQGQYELAVCYRYGWGTDKNIKKAKEWYQKAVEKKHSMARRALNDKSWQTEG